MALEDAAADAKDPAAAAEPAKDGAAAASAEAGKDGAAADAKGGAAATAGADGKTVDAAAEVDGDQGTSILDADSDEGGEAEEGAEGDDKAAAGKDGKAPAKDGDKKPGALPPDWSKVRDTASTKYAKTVEARLAKKVTAAELPAELAKEKTAFEKFAAKYRTPEDALIAAFHADKKIRSGGHNQPLPDDASDAEKAARREELGLPAEAKDYDIPKIAGHEWKPEHEPGLADAKALAHRLNLPQSTLNELIAYDVRRGEQAKQLMVERQTQTDRADSKTAREALRAELEGDFGPSMEVMGRLLKDPDIFQDGFGELLATARTPDGRRLINQTQVASGLIKLAMKTYGEGSMVTGQVAEAMASEEKELEALMNTDISTYMNKPWKSTGKTGEARYYEIMKKKEGKRAA